MNNIGQIQAQIMSFEQDTEEELSKMAKHSGIKFWFYYGYIIEFDKAIDKEIAATNELLKA